MTDDLEDFLSTASARTQVVRVYARGDLVEQHAELLAQLHAELGDDGTLAAGASDLAQRIEDIQAQMDESVMEITVSSISSLEWTNLLASHPPSNELRRAGHDHDPASFPRAALAACAVKPTIDRDQAARLQKALPAGEWNKLWTMVLVLNTVSTPLPKALGVSELLQANAPLATPSDPGSLAAPSSGDAPAP